MQPHKAAIIVDEGLLFIGCVGSADNVVSKVMEWISYAPHKSERATDGLFDFVKGALAFPKNAVVIIAKEHPGDAMRNIDNANLCRVARNN